jgi:hypothetical protein
MKTPTKDELKDHANGKSSKECTFEERVEVSRKIGGLGKRPEETRKQQLDRINRFRCGW